MCTRPHGEPPAFLRLSPRCPTPKPMFFLLHHPAFFLDWYPFICSFILSFFLSFSLEHVMLVLMFGSVSRSSGSRTQNPGLHPCPKAHEILCIARGANSVILPVGFNPGFGANELSDSTWVSLGPPPPHPSAKSDNPNQCPPHAAVGRRRGGTGWRERAWHCAWHTGSTREKKM